MPPVPQAFLRLASVSLVDFGTHDAEILRDVSLAVGQGDRVALMGGGAATRRLLRLVAGLERPTSGFISLRGQPVDGPGRSRCFVFDTPALFPWLTVRGNIQFAIEESRRTHISVARSATDRLIEEAGLSAVAVNLPDSLAPGLACVAEVARALAIEPDVLILGNPLGALGPAERSDARDRIRQLLVRRPTTVLLATEDAEDAVGLAARVMVLSSGVACRPINEVALPEGASEPGTAAWRSGRDAVLQALQTVSKRMPVVSH